MAWDSLTNLRSSLRYAKRLVFVHIGDKTVQYATVLNNLAGTYRLAGKYEEAADLFNESALIYSTTIGKDNSYYCSILNNLALVYQGYERV